MGELKNVVKGNMSIGDEEAALSELEQKPESHIEDLLEDNDPVSVDAIGDPKGNGEGTSSLKALVRSITGEAERAAIASALEKTHWNRTEASHLLGISYRGLLYKIQQYRMSPPPEYFRHWQKVAESKGNRQER